MSPPPSSVPRDLIKIRENAAAADIDLDPETIAEIEAVFL